MCLQKSKGKAFRNIGKYVMGETRNTIMQTGMKEKYEKEFKRYFSEVEFRTKVYNQVRQDTDYYMASRFNVFDYIAPNENKLSDIFADLLNPRGKHGQGATFLRIFLKQIHHQEEENLNYCQVIRESQTTWISKNRRRIDIVLRFQDGFVVAIENKPWSTEQENQLQDYHEHLRKKYKKDNCLVYISGNGVTPTSMELKMQKIFQRNGEFEVLNYASGVITWLEEGYKECQAEKIRCFLRDLIVYINKNFDSVDESGENHV